jgi:DNA modification methylase
MAKMASNHADQTTIPSDYLSSFVIHAGNNLDILPTLPDNSVDSIVTDPPYELGFMGKKWDNSGIAYSVELWTECLRVLKPGGHLLSFGGTRTWHRVAVAIEDAGFDVRDSIAWMYGQGFPKSLNVGNSDEFCDCNLIESRDEPEPQAQHEMRYLPEHNVSPTLGVSGRMRAVLQPSLPEQVSPLAGWSKLPSTKDGGSKPSMEGRSVSASPQGELSANIDGPLPSRLDNNEALKWQDSVASSSDGTVAGPPSNSDRVREPHRPRHDEQPSVESGDVSVKSRPQAGRSWQVCERCNKSQVKGWGTALKPAFEPIVVARKPLIGTVAANVLEHGTGALNIDGSRIGTTDNLNGGAYAAEGTERNDGWGMQRGEAGDYKQPTGRWPANVILDEYSAGELDEQSGVLKSGELKAGRPVAHTNVDFMQGLDTHTYSSQASSGGASRFFYCAKASKRDRNEGLEELPKVKTAAMAGNLTDGQRLSGRGEPIATPERQNFHPTVKPTNLMRYLVKLVTPPGGTVLDPFTGSGSTGKAAILEGFDFIGIEMTEEYLPIIDARLKHAEQVRDQQEQAKDEGLF